MNFDPTRATTWRIATATGGIHGFSADRFQITTAAAKGTGGFADETSRGTFSLAPSGSTGLDLVFTPVTTLTWYGNGVSPGAAGTWTTGGANWHNGKDLGPWAAGATAVFSGSGGTVSVTSGTLVLATGSMAGSPALAVSTGGAVDFGGAGRLDATSLQGIAVVPEPSGWRLVFASVIGMGASAWVRRRTNARRPGSVRNLMRHAAPQCCPHPRAEVFSAHGGGMLLLILRHRFFILKGTLLTSCEIRRGNAS